VTDLRSARVLLIGTGHHKAGSGLPSIPAVPATLKALRRALIERGEVPPDNIRVLRNPASPTTMGNAVATVAEEATDVLLVYFVGHGLIGIDTTLHLATGSSDYRSNRISYTALPFRTIRECVRESRARSKIVILDCCWSGLAIETLGTDAGQLAEISRIDGTFVLTAAGSYEKALASADDRYPAFSGALLRWLREGDPDGAAELTLDAAYRSVRGDLVSRGEPEPQRRATGRAGDLVVMRNPAYAAGPAAQPRAGIAPAGRRGGWTMRRRLLTGLVALTVLGPIAGYGADRTFSAACTGAVPIIVGVAPELAGVVDAAADRWTASDQQQCVRVEVVSVDPATTAAALAGQAGRTLTGLDTPSANAPALDVWIPDSSLWLERIRAADRRVLPRDAPSIADSPVVLAVANDVARSAGWTRTPPTWSGILRSMSTSTQTRFGVVDPVVDASGLAMLLAMDPKPTVPAAPLTVGLLKALGVARTELRDEMLNRLGRSTAVDRQLVDAAPMPEYAVAAYNARNPRKLLALVRPTPLPTSMDYPYAILPTTTGAKAIAAARFRDSLADAGFVARLAAGGFRAPSPTRSSTNPGIDTLLTDWLVVARPVRALLLVDVSAASATPVPNAGGISRLEVTSKALTGAIELLDDRCAAGVWTYATRSGDTHPYQSLVPLTPMSAGRADLQAAFAGLTTDDAGRNSLYDAILAGYRSVLDDWQWGERNMVLVMAAGGDPGSGAASLVQKLRRLKDPHRPVEVAVVFVGSSPTKQLREAAATADLHLYPSTDGAKVGNRLLQALTSASWND